VLDALLHSGYPKNNPHPVHLQEVHVKYLTTLQAASDGPDALEAYYQSACQAGEEAEFRADLLFLYEQNPGNLLLTAWSARFAHAPLPAPRRRIRWDLAIILGVVNGLLFWAISDSTWTISNHIPYYALIWAPIATLLALIFVSLASHQSYRRSALLGAGLIAATGYALLINQTQRIFLARPYLELMAIHLPLLCWIILGLAVQGPRSAAPGRFAFLIKSIEVMIAAGLYLIFGVAFGMITLGMFAALDVTLPDIVIRLIAAGGFGLLPLLALATMYDPALPPEKQDFNQGLSKFIFTLVRLLLPLTIIVLTIYIFFIPFNFLAPFQERDVLIVYNVMLFAILGLLMGVTPLKPGEISPRLQINLRRGIIAVAILAGLVSLYALAAVLYRTLADHLTMNRTMIIGWNGINLAILAAIIYTQLRHGFAGWAERLQAVFSKATLAYLVWTILIIVAMPLIFR
jgi:hypothetical protein